MNTKMREFEKYFKGRLKERVCKEYEFGDLYYYFNQLVNISPIGILWEVTLEEKKKELIEFYKKKQELFEQICQSNKECFEKLKGEKELFEERPVMEGFYVENYILKELEEMSLEELRKDAKIRAQKIFDRQNGLNSFQ